MKEHFALNQPLSSYCTFKVGGNAKYFAKAFDADGLKRALELSDNRLILGKGSKVLISDKGFDGVVILMCGDNLRLSGGANAVNMPDQHDCLERICLKNRTDNDFIVYADAGVSLPHLSGLYARKGFSGLEWALGIPASIGGAVKLNAGAYGGNMSQIVAYVDVLRGDKKVRIEGEMCGFAYRHSGFYPSDIILGAGLKAKQGNKAEIERLRQDYIIKRTAAQPVGKSCGSVFKADKNPAYQYILKAGLSGLKIGGAQISTKHANFILNTGDATAKDIYTLIQTVKAEVFAGQGVRLQEEVIYVGEF